MKLEILTKSQTLDPKSGEIITRYGCRVLFEDSSEPAKNAIPTVNITILKDTIGEKGIGDTIELA